MSPFFSIIEPNLSHGTADDLRIELYLIYGYTIFKPDTETWVHDMTFSICGNII